MCITTVLLIQAVLFADGGITITALGANCLNMAVIGVWVGWGLTQIIQRLLGGSKGRLPLAAGITAHIPHPEVPHYEFWQFGKIRLAIAKQLSQISVTSVIGQGSKFQIELLLMRYQ